VTSLGVSLVNKLIVSGSRNQRIMIWDADTGEVQRECLGHSKVVTSVEFSTDGCKIVSSSNDSLIMVWKLTDI